MDNLVIPVCIPPPANQVLKPVSSDKGSTPAVSFEEVLQTQKRKEEKELENGVLPHTIVLQAPPPDRPVNALDSGAGTTVSQLSTPTQDETLVENDHQSAAADAQTSTTDAAISPQLAFAAVIQYSVNVEPLPNTPMNTGSDTLTANPTTPLPQVDPAQAQILATTVQPAAAEVAAPQASIRQAAETGLSVTSVPDSAPNSAAFAQIVSEITPTQVPTTASPGPQASLKVELQPQGTPAAPVQAPAEFVEPQPSALTRQIASQIIQQLEIGLPEGSTDLRLQSAPEQGGLVLQIVKQGQQFSLSITAEQASTGRLLETQMDQLQEALKAQGLQINSTVLVENSLPSTRTGMETQSQPSQVNPEAVFSAQPGAASLQNAVTAEPASQGNPAAAPINTAPETQSIAVEKAANPLTAAANQEQTASASITPAPDQPVASAVPATPQLAASQANVDEAIPAVEIQQPVETVNPLLSTSSSVTIQASDTTPALKMAAPQPNLPADDVINQVIRQIQNRQANSASTMRLHLNPEELGVIDIQMVKNSHGLSLTIFAEQASTGRLLETQIDQLRQSFKDSGIQLADVNINQHNQPGQQGGSFRQAAQFTYYARRSEPEKITPLEMDLKRPAQRIAGTLQSVDYLV